MQQTVILSWRVFFYLTRGLVNNINISNMTAIILLQIKKWRWGRLSASGSQHRAIALKLNNTVRPNSESFRYDFPVEFEFDDSRNIIILIVLYIMPYDTRLDWKVRGLIMKINKYFYVSVFTFQHNHRLARCISYIWFRMSLYLF